jgi:hypothetical protein
VGYPVAKTSCEEMTMDYSQLSDFEINKRVAICCGFAPEDCEIAKLGTSIVGVEWDDETGYAIKTVDYCKSPSDAEPIIVENRIGIIPAPENGLWKAAHRKVGSDSTPYHMTQDENPQENATEKHTNQVFTFAYQPDKTAGNHNERRHHPHSTENPQCRENQLNHDLLSPK